MVCIHCGSEQPENAAFCPACGQPTVSPAGISATSLGASTVIAPETAFFNVGTTKLVLMTIGTFGLYQVYWLYKNWSVERTLSEDSMWPLWRALFAPIFIYALAARVSDRAVSIELPTNLRPLPTAVAFILLSLAVRAPDPFWMISVLAGLVLIPIQNELARLNAARGIGVGKEAQYSTINTVWLTLSALLWLLIIAGMMLPEAA